MVVCRCKCHQDPTIKSNCGRCNNTGIEILELVVDRTTNEMKPFKEKPFYAKPNVSNQ